jgi:hypothetical protein
LLIENNKKNIPKEYFFDNPSLKESEYGDFVSDETIPLEGFSLNLFSFHFYSEITALSAQCFFGCESLKEIHLPSSITQICTECFLGVLN